MFDRKQQNSVKQVSLIEKNFKVKKTQNQKTYTFQKKKKIPLLQKNCKTIAQWIQICQQVQGIWG